MWCSWVFLANIYIFKDYIIGIIDEYNPPKRVLLIKLISKSFNQIVCVYLPDCVLNWNGNGC